MCVCRLLALSFGAMGDFTAGVTHWACVVSTEREKREEKDDDDEKYTDIWEGVKHEYVTDTLYRQSAINRKRDKCIHKKCVRNAQHINTWKTPSAARTSKTLVFTFIFEFNCRPLPLSFYRKRDGERVTDFC